MKKTIRSAALALALSICAIPATVPAGEVLLGSPDFKPTPERPIGWRGDGSGRYPAAEPPLHWGRTAKTMKQLRSQAAKPKEGETGTPMPDGVIREWLVLGPLPPPGVSTTGTNKVLAGETGFSPDENESVTNLTWKRLSSRTDCVDLRGFYGDANCTNGAIAYAHTYLHVEADTILHLQYMPEHPSRWSIWLNGQPLPPTGKVKLTKGWNRLLIRTPCATVHFSRTEPNWYFRMSLYGTLDSEYEEENIAWTTRLPGWAIAMPLIVGDRIFVTGEYRTLCCLDKKDGKILWVRTSTFFELMTDEEKKANPATIQELEPLVAKLADMDKRMASGEPVSGDMITGKYDLERKINKLTMTVDPKKYANFGVPHGTAEPGVAVQTPVSDGKRVYVSYMAFLVACYNLDGKLQWIAQPTDYYKHGEDEACVPFSPQLAAGNLGLKNIALDARTGKPAWRFKKEDRLSQNQNDPAVANYFRLCGDQTLSSTLRVTLGGEPLFINATSVMRARDGRFLASLLRPNVPEPCSVPTPVLDGNTIYKLEMGLMTTRNTNDLHVFRLPASADEPFKPEFVRTIKIDTRKYPRYYVSEYCSSPLYDNGLVYCVNEDGVLSVVDVEKGEVAYQEFLDADLNMAQTFTPARGGMSSSPALAGKYIYLFGNRGTCLVIEPGRSFKQVARNRIEFVRGKGDWMELETTVSTPIFEGKRMYYRAQDNLYCVEEKK